MKFIEKNAKTYKTHKKKQKKMLNILKKKTHYEQHL